MQILLSFEGGLLFVDFNFACCQQNMVIITGYFFVTNGSPSIRHKKVCFFFKASLILPLNLNQPLSG